ncbi:MAG: thiamine pyrophosphate-dependent dehydrogenase E1 component subunit alpha [Desulfobacteraceae bacterium]|nr:thiamine pyrophosphate-dependent dehydrogenase E1 component subunit alpha [Desulfobacteraceae bacterium]
MPKLSKKKMIRSYTQMIRIRKMEEKLMEVFGKGEIPGFIHVCIGQEATPVAVCSHLSDSDYMANTHRGHGHALAKGIQSDMFMAELFGRSNGPCRGRAGSMHLADMNLGVLGANGIVGGGIPIANGAAFAAKYKKTKQVTVCFFGEGATNEGTFHESLNLASVMNLPIVFVCENNGWAEFTPQSVHMSIKDVAKRAASYDIPAKTVSNDFFEIHGAAEKFITRARQGNGPSLLEVQSSRWHGHFVGDAQKYRRPEEIESAMELDCIAEFEKYLLGNKIINKKTNQNIREEIQQEIEAAVEYARQSPLADASELMEELWA